MQAFDGDLDDYRNWLLKKAAEKRAASTGTVTLDDDAASRQSQGAAKAEAEERQRRAQQRKPLQKELDKIETHMARLAAEKTRLDALLSDAAIYEEVNKPQLTQVLREQAKVYTEQTRLKARWLELQAQIEAMGSA